MTLKLAIIKQKTYNVEDFLISDNDQLDVDIDSSDEKDMKKIVVLFKKLISKILKSNWIADIDASSHMIDQLRLFNESLKSIKRRTIKIEEEKLYSNQCDTMTMRVKNDKSRLTKILYVSDLEVNLLFERRFIKKKLKESFDDNDLYMHIKQSIVKSHAELWALSAS